MHLGTAYIQSAGGLTYSSYRGSISYRTFATRLNAPSTKASLSPLGREEIERVCMAFAENYYTLVLSKVVVIMRRT